VVVEESYRRAIVLLVWWFVRAGIMESSLVDGCGDIQRACCWKAKDW